MAHGFWVGRFRVPTRLLPRRAISTRALRMARRAPFSEVLFDLNPRRVRSSATAVWSAASSMASAEPAVEMESFMPVFESRITLSCKCRSAGQLVAGQLQAGKISQHGYGNRFGFEKLVGQFGEILGSDGFDFLDEFVEIVEAVEIHFLASQIRHAGGARFEREHQAAFELGFGALEFFFRHRFGFEAAKLFHHRLNDFRGRCQRSAGVDRQASSITIWVEIAVDRVGQALTLTDVLEEPGTHASAEQGVENV